MRWPSLSLAIALFSATAAIGDQWKAVGAEDSLGYWAVAIDPRSPNVLYADAKQGRQLWKSVDGGVHWSATRLDVSDPDIVIVETARAAGVSVLHQPGNRKSIARSTDGGISWTPRGLSNSFAGVPNGGMAIDAQKPDTIYVSYHCLGIDRCTHGGGVARSTDGGRSWKGVLSDISTKSVTADPVTTGIVYANTTNGLLRSIDSGSSWRTVGPLQSPFGLFLIDPTTGMTLYFIDPSGVSRSDDRGETWVPVLARFPESWPYYGIFSAGAVDPTNRSVIVVSKGTHGIYRSEDGGATWQPLRDGFEDPYNPGLFAVVRQFAWANDGTLWASSLVNGLHVLERAAAPPTAPTRRRAVSH